MTELTREQIVAEIEKWADRVDRSEYMAPRVMADTQLGGCLKRHVRKIIAALRVQEQPSRELTPKRCGEIAAICAHDEASEKDCEAAIEMACAEMGSREDALEDLAKEPASPRPYAEPRGIIEKIVDDYLEKEDTLNPDGSNQSDIDRDLIEPLTRELAAPRTQKQPSREDVLEEAATVCEKEYADPNWNGHYRNAAINCAAAIRALKGAQPGLSIKTPITFRESSYAIFDVKENAVRTTKYGNLAIFSVRAIAEQLAAKSGSDTKVVEISIYPASDKH